MEEKRELNPTNRSEAYRTPEGSNLTPQAAEGNTPGVDLRREAREEAEAPMGGVTRTEREEAMVGRWESEDRSGARGDVYWSRRAARAHRRRMMGERRDLASQHKLSRIDEKTERLRQKEAKLRARIADQKMKLQKMEEKVANHEAKAERCFEQARSPERTRLTMAKEKLTLGGRRAGTSIKSTAGTVRERAGPVAEKLRDKTVAAAGAVKEGASKASDRMSTWVEERRAGGNEGTSTETRAEEVPPFYPRPERKAEYREEEVTRVED